MPFDALPTAESLGSNPAGKAISLYQARREGAAALWRGIHPTKFDITAFRVWDEIDNRSFLARLFRRPKRNHYRLVSACALGWLAEKSHDGWTFDKSQVSHDGHYGMHAAARYFGLSLRFAFRMFNAGDFGRSFYACADLEQVTPSQVAQALLAQPIDRDLFST